MNKEAPREQIEFWTISNGSIVKTTGYSCAPSNPDVWWLGHGWGTIGYNLFDTKQEALDKAARDIELEIEHLQQRLKALKETKL